MQPRDDEFTTYDTSFRFYTVVDLSFWENSYAVILSSSGLGSRDAAPSFCLETRVLEESSCNPNPEERGLGKEGTEKRICDVFRKIKSACTIH